MAPYVSPSDLASDLSVLDYPIDSEMIFNVASDYTIEMKELLAAAEVPFIKRTSGGSHSWLVNLDNTRINPTGMQFRDNSAMAMIDDLRSVIDHQSALIANDYILGAVIDLMRIAIVTSRIRFIEVVLLR